ncbi:MAG: GHKL domain-containing protein, partial [Phaeodactylibacter sp.]|nr:GHKL domain-containing protein [Phaeodactylibacter sp.]
TVLLLNVFYTMLPVSGHTLLAGLFQHKVLNGSLAHLLLNSLLFPWSVSFIQYNYRRPEFEPWSVRKKTGTAILAYFVLSSGILTVITIIRSLVLDSGLDFDFRNFFNMAPLSLAGMASVVLLLFGLLQFGLWLGQELAKLGLSRLRRLGAIAVSVLLCIPLMMALTQDIRLATGILVLLLSLILLDLFIEEEAGSPAWLIIWLGLLAAFGTGFFFTYKLVKGSQERLAFAQMLASPRDSLAEPLLRQMANTDTLLPALIKSEAAPPEEQAELYLLESYPYLGKNYRLQLDTAATNPAGQQLSPGLLFLAPNDSYFTYALGPFSDGKKKQVWLLFRPAIRQEERILQELIPNNPPRQGSYDFMAALGEKAAARRGAIPENGPPQGLWPKAGQWTEEVNSGYAILFYHAPNGYRITVGESPGGYLKPLSLGSYLFVMLLALALLSFGISRYLPLFPATPPGLLIGEPSLRRRIQLSVIALAMGAFIFIGLVTIAYFRRTAIQYSQERLSETVNVLVRNINLMDSLPASALTLNRLANAHKADIIIYGQNGRLLASSAPFLAHKGWQKPQMSPAARKALEERAFRPVVLDEVVNGLAYKAAYVALPDKQGKPSSFLQIPFRETGQALQENVAGFISALFNFYVFLLLMGSALAIAVANSITRPLSAIGEKLRSFNLGRNEPLEWNSQDEIGNLVEAYNQMIAKLEESTAKLRQSEREGAWREMAKQVAHEIKNPLTPMKLSIQYLQHALRSDPGRAVEMISRVSKTLIEQIDGLARIATEFSNFAKMPKAQNEQLNLNEAVSSVYNLFTEHQEQDEDIRLMLPDEPLTAFTDKEQLARVLTNLIKNAQQAIPEGRRGEITIQLYRQNGAVVIKVSDNGTGIPEEIQPKVFQPNFTTKSSGMGLGLAMCKGIVEAAGGRLYFETQADKGTDFFIELPELSRP